MKNKQINWKACLSIFIPSFSIGFFIDQLLKFNYNAFTITFVLPIIMVFMYHDYLFLDSSLPTVNKSSEGKLDLWRHKIFTLIVFIFITSTMLRIFALFFCISLHDLKIDIYLFVAVSFTTILLSIFGDEILYLWFKIGGLQDALDSKENFFNQNNVKMLIYFTYFMLIFITNCGVKSETAQFWINTFATYVAFERFWKFWKEKSEKKILTKV